MRSTAKVVVEFFAPLLDGIGAGGGSGLWAQIHHGTSDLLVPFDVNAPSIKQELMKNGGASSTELHDYKGAGHGFVGTDGANTNAQTESRAHTIAFFASKL